MLSTVREHESKGICSSQNGNQAVSEDEKIGLNRIPPVVPPHSTDKVGLQS